MNLLVEYLNKVVHIIQLTMGRRRALGGAEQEEVLHVFTEEIFLRLPAKHLQTLKSVCRNWFRIISSPYFVGLHLNVFNQGRIRVLRPIKSQSMMMEYTNCDEETEQFPYPPEIFTEDTKIVGSCDGLLCLFLPGATARSITVYNPSTGKYIRASKDDFPLINICWFGHHPSSGEYILVLGTVLSNSSQWKVGVYNFSRTSSYLKPIHSTPMQLQLIPTPVVLDSRGTLLHGTLHWPAKWINRRGSRHVISTYHLDGHNYSEISPPLQTDFKLGVTQGCLFAIFKSDGVFEMWIMKEYSRVEQSWTKYASIQGFSRYKVLSPLGFSPNGDLILDVDQSRLIRYSFNHNKAIPLMDHDFDFSDRSEEAIMCDDSLMSPKIVRC